MDPLSPSAATAAVTTADADAGRAGGATGWSLGADVDDAVAPVWRRLAALLVDQALAVLVGSVGLLAVLPALRDDGSLGALLVPGLLLLLLAAGQWFAEAFGGRTVGGALLGTRTVSARTGRAPGLWAVLVRSVVQALGVLLGGIGVYVVAGSGAWDEGPEQRGWHDKAAGTLVLRARPVRRDEPVEASGAAGLRGGTAAPAGAAAPAARRTGPTSGPPRPAADRTPQADAPAEPRVPPTSGPPTAGLTAPAASTSSAAAQPGPVEPEPVPVEPTPASVELDPVRVESRPAPVEPTPAAVEPEPVLVESRPAPVEPMPAAVEPEAEPVGPTPAPVVAPEAARVARVRERSAPAPSTQPTPAAREPATVVAPEPAAPAPPAPAAPPSAPAAPAPDAPRGLPDATVPTAGLGDLEHTRVGRWAGSLDAASSTLALVLDTGERVPVTGPGLVGRRPVPGAEHWDHLVTVDDPEQSVSSTHLAFWPVDGGLDVVDRGSTNGTVLLDATGKPWTLPPGQPARVGAGWTLVLGSHRIAVTTA
ncbi:RDD family protein [Cellulomonas pakistanensis]|uniref:RDD family protein n=1 Tax=Cellulomonas pakistanensis TaxID=992287 RepID=UPI0019416A3D|nr:RDD family protein [Cellulomonas pakistanensis]